jgi:hypothetical protein
MTASKQAFGARVSLLLGNFYSVIYKDLTGGS